MKNIIICLFACLLLVACGNTSNGTSGGATPRETRELEVVADSSITSSTSLPPKPKVITCEQAIEAWRDTIFEQFKDRSEFIQCDTGSSILWQDDSLITVALYARYQYREASRGWYVEHHKTFNKRTGKRLEWQDIFARIPEKKLRALVTPQLEKHRIFDHIVGFFKPIEDGLLPLPAEAPYVYDNVLCFYYQMDEYLLEQGSAELAIALPIGVLNGEEVEEKPDVVRAAEEAFTLIPDHCCVSYRAKYFMTDDLYNALKIAWEVPRIEGVIGSEEFLFYFLTGQDPAPVGSIRDFTVISESENRCELTLSYSEIFEGWISESSESIQLIMVNENGEWLLDDFKEGTKAQCRDYIKSEVLAYKSGETQKLMRSGDIGFYSDEEIANYEKEFETFINRYGDYLKDL